MSRRLVFVVEDEEDIARLISHNLQAAGFDVQSFVSGASVVSEALRETPSPRDPRRIPQRAAASLLSPLIADMSA